MGKEIKPGLYTTCRRHINKQGQAERVYFEKATGNFITKSGNIVPVNKTTFRERVDGKPDGKTVSADKRRWEDRFF